jgi:hypothetical protein
MAERHNNTVPASNGTYSMNRGGVYNYFPIEQAEGLKPFWALFVHIKTDGDITCSLEMRLPHVEYDE